MEDTAPDKMEVGGVRLQQASLSKTSRYWASNYLADLSYEECCLIPDVKISAMQSSSLLLRMWGILIAFHAIEKLGMMLII